MSRDFDNLDDLNAYILSVAEKTLKNEVYDKVKKEEQRKIQEEVYDKYRIVEGKKENPWVYKRRKEHDGLKASKNIVGEIHETSENELELEITNITKGNAKGNLAGREIAELIEYGDGYNGLEYNYKTNRDGTAWQYLRPRPFTEKTIEELENNEEYLEEFKKVLKNKGLDIE